MSDPAKPSRSDDPIGKAITDFFAAIMGDRDRRAEVRLAAVSGRPEVSAAAEALRKYDFDSFAYGFLNPFDELAEALVAETLAKNSKLEFLVIEHSFVGSHLQNLFRDFEGNACCADKERTVIRALARFFHVGQEIRFDYDGEYTYHLPQTILRDHDSVMAYFDSLYGLYYGRPKAYMQEMLKIAQVAAGRKPRDRG